MSAVDPEAMLSKMVNRGISPETIKMMEYSGLDLKEFLRGFGDVATSVKKSVDTIRNHPLMVKDVPVHGLVIDPNTGRLDLIEDGSLYQG
ncbi:hypothetical protein D3C79_1035870 [compost metagenome]